MIKYKKSERKVDFIKDLKNTSDILEMCHRSDESIYVIKNGYGDMVIMSMESYESQMKRIKIYEYIIYREAVLTDMDEGRLTNTEFRSMPLNDLFQIHLDTIKLAENTRKNYCRMWDSLVKNGS